MLASRGAVPKYLVFDHSWSYIDNSFMQSMIGVDFCYSQCERMIDSFARGVCQRIRLMVCFTYRILTLDNFYYYFFLWQLNFVKLDAVRMDAFASSKLLVTIVVDFSKVKSFREPFRTHSHIVHKLFKNFANDKESQISS